MIGTVTSGRMIRLGASRRCVGPSSRTPGPVGADEQAARTQRPPSAAAGCTLDSPTARADGRVVEPDDGSHRPARSPTAAAGPRREVAGADEGGRRVAGASRSRGGALALGQSVEGLPLEPGSGRGRPPAASVAQPLRRSSPTPEPSGQPMNPIRRWPASSRCRVAAAVPAAPSTSTHGCAAAGLPHGRPNVTKGTPALGQPGRPGVAVVGAGEDERIQARTPRAGPRTWRSRPVVGGGVEHHPVARRGRRPRSAHAGTGRGRSRSMPSWAGSIRTAMSSRPAGPHLPCGLVGPVAELLDRVPYARPGSRPGRGPGS